MTFTVKITTMHVFLLLTVLNSNNGAHNLKKMQLSCLFYIFPQLENNNTVVWKCLWLAKSYNFFLKTVALAFQPWSYSVYFLLCPSMSHHSARRSWSKAGLRSQDCRSSDAGEMSHLSLTWFPLFSAAVRSCNSCAAPVWEADSKLYRSSPAHVWCLLLGNAMASISFLLISRKIHSSSNTLLRFFFPELLSVTDCVSQEILANLNNPCTAQQGEVLIIILLIFSSSQSVCEACFSEP